MKYSLIAIDIDGTIRSPANEISERTRLAIDQVINEGIVVTVATGRMFESARLSTSVLGLKTPIVSFQGAHIADPVTGNVLWHMPLTRRQTSDAIVALDNWEGDIVAYVNNDVYVREITPWAEAYGKRNRGELYLLSDFSSVIDLSPTRLLAVGDEYNIMCLEKKLQKQFGKSLHITRSLPTFCEILNPEAGKHKALEWLCSYLGIDDRKTVAFGNGYNDVHMLTWAGLGIAVEDSVQDVLNVADRIAPPLEEDGVAQILEEFLRRR